MTAHCLLAVVAAGVPGCAPDDAPGPQHVVRDSAGVAIVEIPAPTSPGIPRWTLSSEPGLRIGAVDGPAPHQLHRVRAAFELSDGTIVIADDGSSELRFFTAEGEFVRAAGGEGGGPGEFRRISYAGRLRGDSVLAYDGALHRVSVFDAAGRFAREFTLEATDDLERPPTVVGALSDGTVVARIIHPTDAGSDGYKRSPVSVHLLDPAGSHRALVGRFPGQERYEKIESPRPGVVRSRRRTLPFGRSFEMAAGASAVALGVTDHHELRIFGADGSLRRIVRRPDAAVTPVTDELHERYVDFMVSQIDEMAYSGTPPTPKSVRSGLEGLPRVSSVPAFEELRVSADGSIWVRRYALPWDRAAGARWIVLDREGRIARTVSTPPELRVTDVSGDHVLGVTRDELDVEYVERYGLVPSVP